MKKAVIFDLNGVFIQSPKLSDRFYENFGIDKDKFLTVLKEIMGKVRLADADDCYKYWKPFLSSWGITFSSEEFYDFWFSAERPNSEMVELAADLKKRGFRIFILSNNFKERADFYEKNFPFIKEISEKVYYSWQTNHIKSDTQAYTKVLEENNLKPEDVIFFDDSEDNIKLATSLGISSYLFSGPKDTKLKLGI